MPTLVERLGYPAGAKLLIVNCDDLGACHSSNLGVFQALRSGLATSATLMVPCPWAKEAAMLYAGEDIGVHLTVNSEYEGYRWRPLTRAPSLTDGDGALPRTAEEVWERADPEQVRIECRAQVELALKWGIDVTHLDSHMGTVQVRPELFSIYLDLAVEFGLPLRLSGEDTQPLLGFQFREQAAERGAVFPDHFVFVPGVGSRHYLLTALKDLPPGVTETYFHPAVHSSELMAITPDWEHRVDDLQALTEDGELAEAIRRSGAELVGYRLLRELMRTGG